MKKGREGKVEERKERMLGITNGIDQRCRRKRDCSTTKWNRMKKMT